MQVAITSRHGTLSPGANEHITRKAEKLLTFFDRVTAINVTVDFSTDRINVEILVDAEHRHDLVARESGENVKENVISVFDAALHKMEQQLRKYKEKIQDHRRDPALSDIAEAAEQRNPETNP